MYLMIDRAFRTKTMALDLTGAWDFARREELQMLLHPAETVDELLLDFSKVTFIDASVLASLVALINRMVTRSRVGVVRIIGASRNVVRVFEACRLETLFDFSESAVDANYAAQQWHPRRGTIMQRFSETA